MTGKLQADGLWRDVRTPGFPRGRAALFVDRDGTVIEHVHYLADADHVALVPGIAAAIRAANAAGRAVVLVTNQSGIDRGYFGWDAFEAVQDRMHALLAAEGAVIDAVYACPHAPPDAGGPVRSPYRKPAPGMLLRARDDHALDLARSRIAGDGAHDLAAGKAAGLAGGWLVPTGYGTRRDERARARALADDGFEVVVGEIAW